MKPSVFRPLIVLLAVFGLSTALAQDTVRVFTLDSFQELIEGEGDAGTNVLADAPFTVEWELSPFQGYELKMRRAITSPRPSVDVVFVLDRWGGSSIYRSATPLGPLMDAEPIEDFDDVIAGTLEPFTFGGELYGIPFRSAFHVLWYNADMLAAQTGTSEPPSSMAAFWDNVAATTYTDDNGDQVYGLAIYGGAEGGKEFIKLAMAYGARILDDDLNVTVDSPEMIQFVTDISDAFQAGQVVPNFDTIASGDVRTYLKQGLAAHAVTTFSFYNDFNNPESSQVPGQIRDAVLPAAEGSGLEFAPHQVATWGLVIPAGLSDERKALAWEFIRYLSSGDASLALALNGNGPIRQSAFSDAGYNETEPTSATLQAIAPTAKAIIQAIDASTEILEIYGEEVTAAMLGDKTPEEAMADAATAIRVVVEQ